jgi:hypothetical protein
MSLFFLKNKSINQAEAVKKMSIKEAGLKESTIRDLIAERIDDFLPGLKTIATEFSTWENSGRKLDILAIDAERNLVVIELKRDDDAAHAELQAIRYAAMMSVCSFENIVEVGFKYRKKSDDGVTEDDYRKELRAFMNADADEDIEFESVPQIILISSKFNKEITTTVLWLTDNFQKLDGSSLNVSCFEAGVYELNGDFVLNLDQILPIPQALDYKVRARAKIADIAKQVDKQKADRAWLTLQKHGKLLLGTKVLVCNNQALAKAASDDGLATYLGNGGFKWLDEEYSSLNAVHKALCAKHQFPLTPSIRATKYWAREGQTLSLADEAESLAGAPSP